MKDQYLLAVFSGQNGALGVVKLHISVNYGAYTLVNKDVQKECGRLLCLIIKSFKSNYCTGK